MNKKPSLNSVKLQYHSSILAKSVRKQNRDLKSSESSVNSQQHDKKTQAKQYNESQQNHPYNIQEFQSYQDFIEPISKIDQKPILQHQKQQKRFTLLDDDQLDELDAAINGTKSRSSLAQKQEAMKQAYEKMRQQYENNVLETSNSKDSQRCSVGGLQREQQIVPQPGFNLRSHQNLKNKQNTDQLKNRNKQTCQKSNQHNFVPQRTVEQILHDIDVKAPRILVTYKKINLLNPPKQEDFYSLGLKGHSRDARAPRNSFIINKDTRQGGQECNLFQKALEQKKGHYQQNRFSHFHPRS